MVADGIETQRSRGQTHRGEHHLLVWLLNAALGKVSDAAAHDNRDRIDYGSYHNYVE